MRARLTSPTVGFNPTTPFTAAGQVMDPSVSVPIARLHSPAATAAPLQEEDPHGLRSSACGLRVWPPTPLHPEMEALERMFAHSDRFVLPRMTASSARRRATRGASRWVTLLSIAMLPAVVGSGPLLDVVFQQNGVAVEQTARLTSAVDGACLVKRGGIERDHRVNLRVYFLYPCDRGPGGSFRTRNRSEHAENYR